ncbi:MAG: phage Gp37/Gp68 family protein [Pseudomonadota bacterium]
MADHSLIEWTDATWNPITGCSVVSPGCTNCYAMKLAGTRLRNHPSRAGLTTMSKAGPVWNGQVRFNQNWLLQPLQWKTPRKIFVCAHGDLFADGVPDAWIDQVFAVMALAPQHTFQVLTKRSKRMREYLTAARAHPVGMQALGIVLEAHCGNPSSTVGAGIILEGDIAHLKVWPLPNVHLGVSTEDQQRADERRDDLAELAKQGWTTFVSYEPALGPIDWTGWEFLEQLISGGESGRGARPSHPDWHRASRDFCDTRGIAYFFKQWGEWAPGEWVFDLDDYLCFVPDDTAVEVKGLSDHERAQNRMIWSDGDRSPEGRGFLRVGKAAAGRLLDGVEHNGMPEVRHG